MLCEKRLRKIDQIRDHTIIGICPETGKLKTVTALGLTCAFLFMLPLCVPPGTVRIIFRICSIGDNKNLDVFIQPTARPERLSLVALNLIESLPDGHAPAFQFYMY